MCLPNRQMTGQTTIHSEKSYSFFVAQEEKLRGHNGPFCHMIYELVVLLSCRTIVHYLQQNS